MENNYHALKNRALEKYFSRMNEQQQKAVFKIKGPLLILAGAGSGKTTVLINRIANMIHFGSAYNDEHGYGLHSEEELAFLRDYAEGRTDDGTELANIVAYETINPWNILAITFTNKAAGELKDRLAGMLGDEGEGVMAATFHSLCARILRRECKVLGYGSNFTIYDADDSLRLCKQVQKDLDIAEKLFPPRAVLAEISRAKDRLETPEDMAAEGQNDYKLRTVARIYAEYQHRLKESNAMDFDDLICLTVRLFEQESDVLDHYQNLYKYIMVDEYQDTNMVQFKLVALLAKKYGNLCVVGDDDQSIYSFRGATIENILNFEEVFGCDPEHDVIRLEQNYRSTQNILTCANELIKNNTQRKGKNLWTSAGDGEKVNIYRAADERSEGLFIAETVLENVKNGARYSDHAVLYRMNAQSREIELAMTRCGVPYRIYGGLKFYDRKEVKDMLAYLQVINNHNDMLRLRRIINEPKRGIGEATVNSIEQISSDLGQDPIEIMTDSDAFAPIARRSGRLRPLAEMFAYLTDIAENMSLADLLDELLDKTGYAEMLENSGDEGQMRLENIEELKSSMAEYEENAEEPSLSGYLEEISLYTDIDRYNADDDFVSMMTVHSAKGLEFPCVFIAGAEENVFPSSRSSDTEAEIQEERRLAYVAITRAKRKLWMIHTDQRRLYGSYSYNKPSRFIKELPPDNIEKFTDPALGAGKETGDASSQSSHSLSMQKQLERIRREAEQEPLDDFAVGDRVMHKIFGEGTILKLTPMAGDMLVEVAFDTRGTKKIMAKYAKIKKL